ncbi:MAG: glycosyltransferase family 4 protein [Thermincolia bacterium]
MVKIVHLITDLFTGGAEMMLYKLLSSMDRDRFDPIVVSLTEGGSIQERIESLDIPVYSVAMRPGLPTPVAALRLVRLIKRMHPDIIQGWMYHGNLAAQMAATFLPSPVPVIWNVRQSLYQLSNEKLMTAAIIRLGAKLSGLPSKIINNSKTSAIQHEQVGYWKDKWVIIPNGFDINWFIPSDEVRTTIRSELGLPYNALLIGLIGRYHAMKDHANFFQAAALLLKSISDIHFILAGRDVDDNNIALVQQIADLSISANVHLLGERSDVARLTAALDIASSSSYSEAFPNVIGEAMSCGVPCVVTDVGDSAWIVGETGMVVPPRNSEALAHAWKELIDLGLEGRRALGIAARERIIKYFSLSSVVEQYEALYENLLNKTISKKDGS